MIENMKEMNEEVLSLYELAKKNPENARAYLDMGQILDKSLKAANTHLKRCGVNRTKSVGYFDKFITSEKSKVGRPKTV
mgnify:CR=1 FL=1|tara:strand:- start:4713 stop:4949 length:237 start_codon:yes stop_codon:yes gene_type:complete